MLPFTLDNHFAYGYGDGIFNSHEKASNLWCTYSRCTREPKSFDQECVSVARLLAADASKLNRIPIIMLSGGLDSEVVVKAFQAAEVEFKTITMRFTNEHNSHETDLVQQFVVDTGVDHRFYDLDLLDWIKSDEASELFHGSQCVSVGMTPHMRLMNHIWFDLGGLPVLGNGDLYLEKRMGRWEYVELESMLAWFRHAAKHEILGGIGFFQHTAEITLAAVRHPLFQRLESGQDLLASKILQNSRPIKYKMYHQLYPELSGRPKFNGYEKIEMPILRRSASLGSHTEFDEKFCVPFKEFQAMLEPLSASR